MVRVKPKFLMVRWLDHVSSANWKSRDDIFQLVPTTVTTTGWLVRETEDFIVLSSSIQDDDTSGDGEYGGYDLILKVAIISSKGVKLP